MKIVVGIDLGSTTTKAVILDAQNNIVGRGITNSRSNYDLASGVAREEALVQARFNLARQAMQGDEGDEGAVARLLPALERNFRMQQYLHQIDRLAAALDRASDTDRHRSHRTELADVLGRILDEMRRRAKDHFGALGARKSDFFRDLAAADYMHFAERLSDPRGIDFETLTALFDQAILPVENTPAEATVEELIESALQQTLKRAKALSDEQTETLRTAVSSALATPLDEVASVGTGYGRQRLPFPKDQIRSEILCHGLGAHAMFPKTKTVLDIGGQDTKAIQIDPRGIVTSFQMNDRCAAGCGRYLGYIADEMNLGVHELGPLAQQSHSTVKINSTCTVFAGAELRERLSLGQRREDILAGLHRAIILRAMSLLARSGGIDDEFTFTGGVARNPAAVSALEKLIDENYGERTLNISPDSIYTGALGAAIFALRGWQEAA